MRNKSGVSLIVLVITVIVMIILASAVIISLRSTNIREQAKDAVNAHNINQVKSLVALAWADAYGDYQKDKDLSKVEEKINKALKNSGIEPTDYVLEVTRNGASIREKFPSDWKASVRQVTEKGVPIPTGFVVSPYPNESDPDKGLVIYALTEDEIKKGVTDITKVDVSKQVSLEKRNQFVWVPVNSAEFADLFKRNNFGGNQNISYTIGVGYYEVAVDSMNMPTAELNKELSRALLNEATAMYASVKKYGGFYIGRYEVGADAYSTSNFYGRGNLSITMSKYPYNGVSCNTYNGAMVIARSFYPAGGTTYGAVSTLTYGVQWDRTISWWKELNSNINLTSSKDFSMNNGTNIEVEYLNTNAKYASGGWTLTEWASPSTSNFKLAGLMTTGAYQKASVFNIYDMAGSLYEWTMELTETGNGVLRGTCYINSTSESSVAARGTQSLGASNVHFGFRPSLYIK